VDHYELKVKRRNLIELFKDTLSADKFVVTHLYG
jgi:proton-coupled amino acid transporter